jgi:Tfp pilus assembly protein PilO
MTSFMDRWNLRPQERRLVVVVAAVFFVMLNIWFVWPYFKEWQTVEDQRERNQRTLNRYRMEIANAPAYETKLSKLEADGGAKVLPAEQSIDFLRTVQSLAKSNHVEITRSGQPIKSAAVNTNSFFEEVSLPIDVTTAEKDLVDFLYELGSGNSMIRVRDLQLSPGSTGTNLSGRITLVASYQKAVEKPSTQAPEAKVSSAPAVQPRGKVETPKSPVHSVTSAPPRIDSRSITNNKPRLDSRVSTNTQKKP